MSDSINEILAKINPITAARFKKASEQQNRSQRVPSIGMQKALGEGLRFGRQVMVWGNKSASKSSFCLELIALAQEDGRSCAWIDAENSWDKDWAASLGVDNDNIVVSRSKTITDVTTDVVDLMAAKTDIIVVDSISTLLPSVYFEKNGDDLKVVEKSKQIGGQAGELTIATNMWNYANENTLLIVISQQRNQFGSMHVSHIPTGGKAMKFNSSVIIKMWASEAADEQISEQVPVGDRFMSVPVGRRVRWTVQNNKTGPQNRDGEYDFYYAGDKRGIDSTGEILDYAEQYGVVKRGGAWYTVNEERIQGRAKTLEYLREHPEIVDKLKDELVG